MLSLYQNYVGPAFTPLNDVTADVFQQLSKTKNLIFNMSLQTGVWSELNHS